MRYQFLDAAGNVMCGSTTLNGNFPEVRDTVAVVFDPDRPNRNTYYPAPLFRIVQGIE